MMSLTEGVAVGVGTGVGVGVATGVGAGVGVAIGATLQGDVVKVVLSSPILTAAPSKAVITMLTVVWGFQP